VAVELAGVDVQHAAMAAQAVALDAQHAAMSVQRGAMAANLAAVDMQLQHARFAELAPLGAMVAVGPVVGVEPMALRASPRASYAPDDPADSLYKLGREAINRGEYDRAAIVFQRLRDRYPNSVYAADALYWQAFSLYRGGDDGDLRSALSLLDQHRKSFPDAATSDDARTLRTRVCGEMARRGDERCASDVARAADPNKADKGDKDKAEKADKAKADRAGVTKGGIKGRLREDACTTDEDDDMRIAALNALLQMDADQALPILREVLARRDGPCSDRLRKKAVFLVSQKNSPESADILMTVARGDPNEEIRSDAVFWLSQVRDPRAVELLDSILRTTREDKIQEKAIFALSQHRSTRAREILRTMAERTELSEDVRNHVIFSLGHHSGRAEDATYLRSLYPKLTSERLKETLIQSVAQVRGGESGDWLMSIVRNEREPMELRKKALFWAGQRSGADVAELTEVYDQLPDREMREQAIFALSQRRERPATLKLIDIARNEKDRELRKKAIFWLGQKKDPEVAKILLEIINQE
jgi:HEAT repeat protein